MSRRSSKIKPLPTRARLLELLEYDEINGVLRWREWRGGTAFKGSIAGSVSAYGRRVIAVDGVMFYASRLIHKMRSGRDPKGFIDHRDRNPGNNQATNLHDVTPTDNAVNQVMRKDNKPGIRGVSFYAQTNCWKASISVKRKLIHLGCFKDQEAARLAYVKASMKHHPARWQ